MIKATVAVCTRDRPDLLAGCLSSIRASLPRTDDVEVLVVEQGDPTAAEVTERVGIQASIIHDPGKGAARARNIAARNARGELILFTDDDCEVPCSWIQDYVEVLEDPLLSGAWGPVAGLDRLPGADPAAVPAYRQRGAPPWLVGHGANMAIRTRPFLDLGGFDERLGPGTARHLIGEDSDLIFRLLASGATIRTGVGAPVLHREWRSADETHVNLRRYERGTGAWVGKALREYPRQGARSLLARIRLQRDRFDSSDESRRYLITLMADFWRGVALGIMMGPWSGATENDTTAASGEGGDSAA